MRARLDLQVTRHRLKKSDTSRGPGARDRTSQIGNGIWPDPPTSLKLDLRVMFEDAAGGLSDRGSRWRAGPDPGAGQPTWNRQPERTCELRECFEERPS